jgi:hypothetical protein
MCVGCVLQDVMLHGFDSFEGLPEAWQTGLLGADGEIAYPKGAFDLGGIAPLLDPAVGANVRLHPGWFVDTVPHFFAAGAGSLATAAAAATTAAGAAGAAAAAAAAAWTESPAPSLVEGAAPAPVASASTDNAQPRPVVAFVHADADLYSSTVLCLKEMALRGRLVKGTVINFDEYWNYPDWQNGEYKAWCVA